MNLKALRVYTYTRCLVAALVLCCFSLGWAQSYQWRDVAQDVDIRSDGTIIVNDERTLVATSGDFNEAFICLDLTANQSLELLDGGALGPGPSARAYTQPCEDGSGGTELVVEMDNEVRVTERRVFYRYALSGALDYYSDVVQWYWIIMEQDHPPVRGYTLDVFIPGTMQDPFDAFVHRFGNPESPTVRLAEGRNRLTVTFDRIPDGDGVEIRYLMDPMLFAQQGSAAGLEQLLRDEQEVTQDNQKPDISQNSYQDIDTPSSGYQWGYQWRDVVQSVDIQSDGTVIVNDERTLSAGGNDDFNEAFICLDLTANQNVELLDGGALGPGPSAQAYTQPCEDGSGGTELVVEMDNEVRVTGRRVFYRYALSGALDYYRDVVQWYWIILEEDHPPVRYYELTVTAPGPMSAPYEAYVHRFGNPETPDVSLSEARDELRVTFDRIPDGDGVEIRYLMDPVLFDRRGSEVGLSQLLRDEERIIRASERRERWQNAFNSVRQQILTWLSGAWQQLLTWLSYVPSEVIFSPHWAVIAFVISFVRMKRDRQRVRRGYDLPEPEYLFEPPDDLPPALVSALLYEFDSEARLGAAFPDLKKGFGATVMDLARRGYGEFRTSTDRSSGFFGLIFGRPSVKFEMQLNLDKDRDELLPFERKVLGYLLSAARRNGDPSYLTFKELQSHSLYKWRKFYGDWSLDTRVRAHDHFLPGYSSRYTEESWEACQYWKRYAFKIGALGVALVFAAFLFNDQTGLSDSMNASPTLFFWHLSGILGPIVVAFLINVSSKSLPVLRDEIVVALNNWVAFARTLRDYSIMERAPDDFYKLWDRYFCYAAALGVARSYLANIKRGLADHGFDEQQTFQQTRWLANNVSSSGLDSGRDVIDVSALSSAVESVASALKAEPKRSSSSGGRSSSGGGASSGGSSGGGGGGGGGGSSGGR